MSELRIPPERWPQIQAILDRALDLPIAERATYLAEVCADDEALHAQVASLLAADDRADHFLSTPAAERLGASAAGAVTRESPDMGPVPDPLGPYELVRELGRGGMGVVYEAADSRLGRTVAIKLLPGGIGLDAKARERFIREARAASAFDHPNICTVHDIGETDDGRLYIVMAYYRGETLERKLERGPLSLEAARDLTVQIARGLERAHESEIVHRDIKPANVIVTDRGEVKILDFGIAKIAGAAHLTRTGGAPGTPAYMAPEQARGEKVDGRADLWSLGVMLYEMLAGGRPFVGDSAPSVLHAILEKDPEPIGRVRHDVAADLATAVERCLEKNVKHRYRDASALLADLDPVTATTITARSVRRRRWSRPLLILLAVALVWTAVLVVVRVAPWRVSDPVPVAPAGGSAEQLAAGVPSVGILLFSNYTGDAAFDWLRHGLTEMLVLNLQQTQALRVVGTSELYQVLEDAGALDQEALSADMLRSIADGANVSRLVRGNFAHDEGGLRITVTVESPTSGDPDYPLPVSGKQDAVLAMVDELSTAIRRQLGVEAMAPITSLEALTTSSIDAWRAYTEGLDLYNRSHREEAIAQLEQAISVDPAFVQALLDLGRMHDNLGHKTKAADYWDRAFALRERLPVHLRLDLESVHYKRSWNTYGKAIETLEEAVRLFPDQQPLRDHLAALYGYVERYEQAATMYGDLIEAGSDFNGTHASAAFVNVALGRMDVADRILAEYARRHPDDWYIRFARGWLLVESDRLEAATSVLDRADALSAGEFFVAHERWRSAVLREAWNEAEAQAEAILVMASPYARWWGHVDLGRMAILRRNPAMARRHFTGAGKAFEADPAYVALAHCLLAELHLDQGDAEAALANAALAQDLGQGQWPALRGIYLAAVAEQQRGRTAAADALLDRLRALEASRPNLVEQRQVHRLAGVLALLRGDAEGAVAALGRAVVLLPPRGIEFHEHAFPDHAAIWFELGEAERAAGRAERAEAWYRKVAQSGAQRIPSPIAYLRSIERLGPLPRP